jgi:hypothetical protein
MASLTSNWPLDPSSMKMSDAAEVACGLRFGVEEDHYVRLITHGVWWTLPIARTLSDEIVAIRLTPNVAVSDSPVLLVNNHEAVTLASRVAFLIPRMVVAGMMGGREHWDRARSMQEGEWSELAVLHRQLGGGDARLNGIRSAAEDDALRDAIHDQASHAAALADLLVRADDSASTKTFRAYVQSAVAAFEAPVPLPDVGCWNAALAAVAFVTNRMLKWKGSRVDRQLVAAWALSNQPPGLDAFQGALPAHLAFPYGQSQTGIPLQAAQTLVDNAAAASGSWQRDELWPAIAAIAKTAGYDGTAHMDAAAKLQTSRQPERAFTAMTAAAYWMFVATGEPFAQLIEGARVLAAESGWAEITEVLDQNMRAVGFER